MTQHHPTSDSPGVLAPPPLIFATGFALGLAVQWLIPMHVFQDFPFRIAGATIAALACILALWGSWTMHRAKTNIFPHQPTLAIVTHGPFRFSRNPLYLSLLLLYVGASIFFDLPWTLPTLLPTLYVITRFVIRREERYLESKFGNTYLQYKQSTRRWI